MAAGAPDMGQILSDQLVKAAKIMEEQLDTEIEKLQNMGEDDMEALRLRRLEAMKKAQQKKQDLLSKGHGEYSEIPEEKEFFEVTKNSENAVIHFYRQSTFRCKIVDKHLAALAPKHVETRFCKIDAEKCPFLVERLKIRVIPTIALIKNAKTRDYIVGFTDLGNRDDFSTEMMEWRIARSELINYSGDLMTPPDGDEKKKKTTKILGKKNRSIRGADEDSSDEDDW